MDLTVETFLVRLQAMQSDEELEKIGRYFKLGEGEYGQGDRFIGVRMAHVFALAREFVGMSCGELEKLLESDIHEARAGALRAMAEQYALRGATDGQRQDLFDLYLRRHDRINNWDLVDLAAWHVVGPHLIDRPRDILYRLARSPSMWERRTAILATFAFIKRGQFEDTIAISGLLVNDPEDLIHKAAGGMLREVGRHDPERLFAFLDKHGATMPRVMLRYALEHVEPAEQSHYMGLAKP